MKKASHREAFSYSICTSNRPHPVKLEFAKFTKLVFAKFDKLIFVKLVKLKFVKPANLEYVKPRETGICSA